MAEKNLMELSDKELRQKYADAAKNQQPAFPMLQMELSYRANEKSANALNRLTYALVGLTILLFGEGGVQTELALGNPGFPKPVVSAPHFDAVGDATYYCSTQSPSMAGPCTLSDIFVNDGGPGTEIATFSSRVNSVER